MDFSLVAQQGVQGQRLKFAATVGVHEAVENMDGHQLDVSRTCWS